jgi:hypothetical protein
MGVVAFLVSQSVYRFVLGTAVPKNHQRYRDRILERLHYLLNLKAELADVEQELIELWEKAPSKQARLIVTTVDRAAILPPALHAIARRYGFSVPDVPEPPAEPPVVAEEAGEREDLAPAGATIIPWTGRAVG